MTKFLRNLIFLVIIICFFIGCAQLQASKGWKLLNAGNPDEAINAFEKSKEKKELPGYYLGMYYSYVEKKALENAEKYIVLGVERFPSDFHLNYAYGFFLLRIKNDRDGAIKYFEKCRELNPGSATEMLEEAISEAKIREGKR